MPENYYIQSTRHLPDHDRILQALFSLFIKIPGVTGCFLSGSTAAGEMDVDSDLDIGILLDCPESRETYWEARWDWELPPWFHRMDADHIKPYFVIYLFEPHIKGDINLYIASDLPPYEGSPYRIVWDDTGALTMWQQSLMPSKKVSLFKNAVHDDERFWAWMFYLYNHVHRGEYYHCASEFYALRDIIEQWVAQLEGDTHFNSRRLENQSYAGTLFENDLFPKPDRESLKSSMLDAIEVQRSLRQKIVVAHGKIWKTTPYASTKIEELVRSL